VTRVALLTEIPAPYRIPLFNALADRTELTVLFLRERHPERPYRLHEDELRFAWRVLPGRHVMTRRWWLVVNRGVIGALRALRPDVLLLGGWNQPAFWIAIAWARLRRVPVILWIESTGRDTRSGRFERVKRALLRAADAFVVPGAAAAAYLESLGVARTRVTIAPNAVDPQIFRAASSREPHERPVILSVARLSPEKGVDVLLRAARGIDADVVIAGTGPEEGRLRRLGGNGVRFLGNVDRDALPSVYASADVLVVPSRSETWGMALNEAAHVGLPLVATDAVGAAHDLIEDGSNGFRVGTDDVDALRAVLERLAGDADLRARFGARSRELSERFTPEVWAAAIVGLVTTLARR
jgi:glycosyltransferase involved in cell wall biosynthesis